MFLAGCLKSPWSRILFMLLIAYVGITSALKGCKNKNRKHCNFNMEGLVKNVAMLQMKNRIKHQILGQLGLPIRHKPTDLDPSHKKDRKEGPTQTKDTNFTVTPTVIKPNISEFLIVSERPGDIDDINIIKFQPHFVFQNSSRSSAHENMVVKSANLLIRLKRKKKRASLFTGSRQPNSTKSRRIRRKVLSLTVSTVDEDGKAAQEIATVKTRVGKSKWFKVTLPSSLIQNMIDKSQSSLLLHIKCRRCRKYTEVILVDASRRERRHLVKPQKNKSKRFRRKKRRLNKSRPILIVKVLRESKSRDRRSLINRGQSRNDHGANNGRRRHQTDFCSTSNTDPESGCCREPLFFDFGEAGLDWIIAPPGFHTSECVGSCHAHNNLTISGGITTDGQEQSCKPLNPLPISVLYFNSENAIVFSRLFDMVVYECSCQSGNASPVVQTSMNFP